jgi:twitching motility protein PilT
MTRLLPDPDLEQLVRELNDSDDEASPRTALHAAPAAVTEGNPLERLLIEMTQRGASDLLLIAGNPPIMRIGGRLAKVDAPVLVANEIASLFSELIAGRTREQFETNGAADFSLRLARPSGDDDRRAWRFRVNVHRQRGTIAAAIRSLPTEIPTLAQLNLPQALADLVKPTRGLVLVCGPTGSGKTTTLAALVGEINRNEQRHIVTIEDPIEFEHRNAKSIIEQVEIGRDAPSFAAALRAALRQDPDVILVGEMRDLETVSIALTAAETGHLILSTLHTSDAAQAIHRIIDVFPPGQQNQIKQQLAFSLNAIVCQQLVPRSDTGGRAVAVEVMLANNAVRNHIRHDKLQQLATEITIAKRQGMISLEDSLARLVRQGNISLEDARIRAPRPDELDSLLR